MSDHIKTDLAECLRIEAALTTDPHTRTRLQAYIAEAEKLTHPQPVTPAMVDSLNATVGRMEELNARQDDRERKLALAVTPAGGEVVSDALVYAVLDAFNEAAGDGELFLTSLRDAMRMRLALAEALKAHPPVADAALRDAERYRFMRQNIDYNAYPKGKPGKYCGDGHYFHNQRGEFNFEIRPDGSWPDFEDVLDAAIDAALNQRGGG